MTATFERPMEELREVFVRQRFAQEDVFGDSEPEKLASLLRDSSMRKLHTLRNPHELARVVLSAMNESPETLSVLEKVTGHQQCQDVPQTWFYFKRDRLEAAKQVATLFGGSQGTRVYWGCDKLIAIVERQADPLIAQWFSVYQDNVDPKGEGNEGHNFKALWIRRFPRSNEIHEVVLAEWYRDGAKVGEASEYCLDLFDQAIERHRGEAEHSFKKAVAISPDGKQIICADYVAVFDQEDRTVRLYNWTHFAEHKVVIEPTIERPAGRLWLTPGTQDRRGQVDRDILNRVTGICVNSEWHNRQVLIKLASREHALYVPKRCCASLSKGYLAEITLP